MAEQNNAQSGIRPAGSDEARSTLVGRQPVVAIVGHVDHGKTTLLDYIRKTRIADREAGGITQAVGAYEITHESKAITFIDTPGHEAFIKMRSRGAEVADLAVLVVAADESVKPQTRESINILEKTKTPFVVAITKIDKPGADVEKVKNDLMTANVFLEGFGGQVSFQPLSSKTGEGVNELLDLILLTAEVENLTYDSKAPVRAIVLEGRQTKQRGFEVTLIVKEGVLRRGETLYTANAEGKVKILENFLGKVVEEIPAGAPAIIIGFESLPRAGEVCTTIPPTVAPVAPKRAAPVATRRLQSDEKMLYLVLKASDAGSLEALAEIVRSLHAKHPLTIVAESVGEITENDVNMAASTKAVIIAFKTKADKAAKTLAEAQHIEIITSEIIYELLKAIDEFLLRVTKPPAQGELEVLAVFNQKKLDRQIVGGKVIHGIFKQKTLLELMRNGIVIARGKLINIQQDKKEVIQVFEGKETGIMVSIPEAIQVGDILLSREQ